MEGFHGVITSTFKFLLHSLKITDIFPVEFWRFGFITNFTEEEVLGGAGGEEVCEHFLEARGESALELPLQATARRCTAGRAGEGHLLGQARKQLKQLL